MRAQIRREIRWSLTTAAIYAVPAGAVAYAWDSFGWTLIYRDPAAYPLWWLPVSVAVYLLAHDAWFYWTHRLMHRPRLFRLMHAVHHDSRPPTAWAAMSFHPLEALSGAFLIPALVFVVPIHWGSLAAVLTVATVFGVTNHLGWEIFPRRWLAGPFGAVMITASHHEKHHSSYRSNFGLYFRLWDRLCGTDSGLSGDSHVQEMLIAGTALALTGADALPPPVTVRIVLTGLRSSAGEVRLCVWHEAASFPDCGKGRDVRNLVAGAAATVTLDVPDLRPGDYAVSAIHDENGNARLDTNRLGIPSEGIGFSQNPRILFGAPSYKAARFAADADITETIRMKYFL